MTEALTLTEAEAESGYSYSALEKLVRAGRIENIGTKGAPRVRRGDLPRKAKDRAPDLAEELLLRRMAG